MNRNLTDIRRLVELYADGEIDAEEKIAAEEVLDREPAAAEYLLALRELTDVVRAPIEDATERVDFSGLFAQVMNQACASSHVGATRNAELEILAMTLADGELHDDAEIARVQAYLVAQPLARDAFEGLSELSELVRMPIEQAADRVDFDALALRIERAIDAEPTPLPVASAETSAAPGFFARLWSSISANPVFASAATAVVVVAIMLPFMNKGNTPTVTNDAQVASAPTTTVVHNHYYMAAPQEIIQEPGYSSMVQHGDEDSDFAPVVWFIAEPKPERTESSDDNVDADPGRPL